ncbi:MAG TPA: NADPH-dependent F420 reductase [Nitrososphaeraceae archaeon]
MEIAIIGAGDVGGTLGKIWIKKGHQIMFGVRNLQSPNVLNLIRSTNSGVKVGTIGEAASFADVIVLAIPWIAVEEGIKSAGDLSGKILIDPTNPINADLTGLVIESSTSAAEEIARWAKGSKVVKAFNSIGAKTLNNLQFGLVRADAFICGDDYKAKTLVKKLATEIGFDTVDAGPLINARLLEYMALLWIQLAYSRQMGPNIAFKLLTRAGGT